MVQHIILSIVYNDLSLVVGQAGGQVQEMPGLADVVAALFLESDDPNQTEKIQFENNYQIPQDEFPAEKQKILLLAYSRCYLYYIAFIEFLSDIRNMDKHGYSGLVIKLFAFCSNFKQL